LVGVKWPSDQEGGNKKAGQWPAFLLPRKTYFAAGSAGAVVVVVVVVVVSAGAIGAAASGAAASGAGAIGAAASGAVVVVVVSVAGAAASSFLPQAVKDKANRAASRTDFFICVPFYVKYDNKYDRSRSQYRPTREV
jgi:hypothetical protein